MWNISHAPKNANKQHDTSANKSVVNFWKRFGGTGEEKSFDGISYYYNVITAVIYENQVRKLNNELLMKVVKV